MKHEPYHCRAETDFLYFEFESVSEARVIRKIVTYAPLWEKSSIYNLGFGDYLQDGTICDLTVSNNADMPRVIATIVGTLFLFLNKYPFNSVFITGSTPSRTRLYRMIITRELPEAKKFFNIYGTVGPKKERFRVGRNYDGFLITLKKQGNGIKLEIETES